MKHMSLGSWSLEPQKYGPPVVMGQEALMSAKAHGTSAVPVQEDLRWGCDPLLADDVCNFNRRGAEDRGYWQTTSFLKEAATAESFRFYDSNSGRLLFSLPSNPGRSLKAFVKESKEHGWPSFRDAEVCWRHVRVLPGGEVVSIDGTHLGHNLPDYYGNRYCINILSIAGLSQAVFAAGCFWSVEKAFWRLPGVYSTAVGFCGGLEEAVNPSYLYVCTGESGHCEAVQVVWDPAKISFSDLLRLFWACHDPTQGDAQGRDSGSQYRSAIFCSDAEQATAAHASRAAFADVLRTGGYSEITTEIRTGCPFYYADLYHQQYLAKPRARRYCSAEPTGLALPAYAEWRWPAPGGAEDTSGAAVAQARQRFAPLLPESFWRVYDFSISAPDEPAGLSAEELAGVERGLTARRASWEACMASAEKQGSVLVQHCASCGYTHRAAELAAFLKTACGAQAQVVVIADATVGTGSFEVRLKHAGDQGLSMVHSKKAGHGFVDNAEKLAHILDAIARENPSCALPRQPNALIETARKFGGFREKSAAAQRRPGQRLLAAECRESLPMPIPRSRAPTLLLSKREKSKRR